MIYGIYITFITIFFFALYDTFNRVAISVVGAAPWQLALWQLIFASLVLLLFSGWGRTGLNTLKSWYTWGIGLTRVMSIVLFLPALAYVSATEATLLLKLNVFVTMGLAYYYLNRKPAKSDLVGITAIVAGLALIISNQMGGLFSPAVLLIFGATTTISISTFLTELHPVSNQSISVRARCRYTAVVLFVISVIFLIMSLLLSFVSPSIHAYVTATGDTSWQVLMITAFVGGVFIRAPTTYFSFLAIRLVKSENYLMLLSLIPFVTMGLESILILFGIFPENTISGQTILAALLISGGSLFNMYFRANRHIEKNQPKKEPLS